MIIVLNPYSLKTVVNIGHAKPSFLSVILWILSVLTYVLGAQMNTPIEMVLLSTYNIYFRSTKNIFYILVMGGDLNIFTDIRS